MAEAQTYHGFVNRRCALFAGICTVNRFALVSQRLLREAFDHTWQCPGILRLGKIQKNGKTPRVHYSPTMFDGKPETPRKWPRMPWIVEIGSVHGHGPLCILPDGSVHDWDTYIATLQP